MICLHPTECPVLETDKETAVVRFLKAFQEYSAPVFFVSCLGETPWTLMNNADDNDNVVEAGAVINLKHFVVNPRHDDQVSVMRTYS